MKLSPLPQNSHVTTPASFQTSQQKTINRSTDIGCEADQLIPNFYNR